MLDHPILSQINLAYSPVIDRQRAVVATRLTVYPEYSGHTLSAQKMLDALHDLWPQSSTHPVWLNIADEHLLLDLLQVNPSSHMGIEVPAFIACDPAHQAAIGLLHAQGNTLLLNDRPNINLPTEVLNCFTHAVVDLDEERRLLLNNGTLLPQDAQRRDISFVQKNINTVQDMEHSFQRGAMAVMGWPIDAVTQAGTTRKADQPALQSVVRLIDQVHREAPIEDLEDTLKHDPALAYKLLRFINSAAFGLSVEISSFRHAIMVLGYNRLQRWLALLLATASKDPNMRPVMYAAVRRGLLMEQLGKVAQNDEHAGELFICGVFSLLDRMFNKPFSELFDSIPVSEPIFDVLSNNSGPYQPYFHMMQSLEGDGVIDIREARDSLMITAGAVNTALLQSLQRATELDH